jgi:hypothetical protein
VENCSSPTVVTGRPSTRIRTDAVGSRRFTVHTTCPTRSRPEPSASANPRDRSTVATPSAYRNSRSAVPGGIAVSRLA